MPNTDNAFERSLLELVAPNCGIQKIDLKIPSVNFGIFRVIPQKKPSKQANKELDQLFEFQRSAPEIRGKELKPLFKS